MAKKLFRYSALLLAILIAFALVYARIDGRAHAAAVKGEAAVYVCPMDGEVISDKPGKCPKCGMELVKQTKKPAKKTVYVCPMDGDVISDKPGKCPKCGMKLVAKSVDANPPQPKRVAAAQHDMKNMPAQSAAAPAPKANGERKILYWYDPMHPAYKSDKPGTAPDCGMDLVPKYADDETANMAPGTVMISADKQQLIGVRTATVQRESLVRTVRTTGQLVVDESRVHHVHVKVAGFVEDAFVNYVGQFVKKGQPLFTLYSPELVSAQQEYLIAKRGAQQLGGAQFSEVSQGANALLRATRERLKLWDISDEQVRKLDESGKVSDTLTFYSPVSGFVQERKVYHHTAVTPETDLYMISDLSSVWLNADVYEYEAPFVHVGQKVDMQLSYYPGKTWKGVVSFIYPTVDPMTRTMKVRVEVPNPKFELKPQMFAEVMLKANYGNHIVVPQEAVLNSGNEQTVFVAREGGHFEPRPVKLGAQIDGKAVVLSGLKAGETIVTSGNFLIDSESRLKSAMGAMQH